MDFVINSFRIVFFQLDKIVYGLIDDMYGLLLQLTRTSVFDQEAIHSFSERIYALIGIFMLFKVSVSLINYILNPDEFADKEKGFGSIMKHVIFSLVMLVLAPYIFNEAFELQSIILEENTIMNLAFGSPSTKIASNSSYADEAGSKIQFVVLYAFAQPNYSEFSHDTQNFDLIDCKYTYAKDSNGDYIFRQIASIDPENSAARQSSFIYELEPSCWGVYDVETDTYAMEGSKGQLIKAFSNVLGDSSSAYQNYAQGVAQQSFSLFFKKEAILAKTEDGRYLIDYKFGISTAVGIAVLYLFLLFSIDVAVRSVKLGFLQMIAPIPILSYCDPKSGKDGMFKKWFDMCTKSYLELFIRLFALYFGIYVITLVGKFRDVVTGDIVDDKFATVFMIIGVLIFIKKLPEIIKEVFNIKGDAKFELNPFKKLENEAIGGKQLAGAGRKAVGVAGGVATGALAGTAGLLTGQGFHRAAFTNAIKGGWNGDKFNKNFSSSYGAARARHKQLQEMAADGVNRRDVAGDKIYNAFHGQTRSEHAKSVSAGLKSIQDDYKSYEATAAGVDAIAKDFDKRRKAAEAKGDYADAKRWNSAFDNRLKEIASSNGTVVSSLNSTFDANTYVDASGSFTGNWSTYATATSDNATLQNIASKMENTANAMNKQGADVAGYQDITVTPNDLKNIKNQAQNAQQSVDTNATNRAYEDVAKYSGGKKNN